jgi:oxalate decarboxylase/phosphoglucose isomerase-like protein (cupin superfamily)
MKTFAIVAALGAYFFSMLTVSAQTEPRPSAIFAQPVQKPTIWQVDKIKWDTEFPDGTKLAILEGPRDVPGKPFSYAFFMPDGIWVQPHWHCADARVFVVKGTLLIGFQADFDKKKVIELNAGDYFLAPFRYPHYEGSRGETLIIGTGVGPWCTVEISQKP